MNSSESMKRKIVNAAFLLLALFVASRIYQAQARGILQLKERESAETKKIQVLKDIGKLEEKIAAYKEIFPARDISSAMDSINDIARSAGVKIVSIKPQAKRSYATYSKNSFEISINANDFHQIGAFVSAIESVSEPYLVETVRINPLQAGYNEIDTGALSAAITISVIIFE